MLKERPRPRLSNINNKKKGKKSAPEERFAEAKARVESGNFERDHYLLCEEVLALERRPDTNHLQYPELLKKAKAILVKLIKDRDSQKRIKEK